MTVRTRIKKIEDTVGGASEYVPLETYLASVLCDDPKRKAAAKRAMRGRRLDPRTEELLISLATMPEREASQ